MKKSEIRKLVSEYHLLKTKKRADSNVLKRLAEIERQYYHETGQEIC